jgi:hypothetical protein
VSVADWGAAASAAVAFLSMLGAGYGWLQARREKDAAAEHERRAVEAAEAAAGHEKRSADAEERIAQAIETQESRAAEHRDATEADPWIVEPIPGDDDVYLINRSSTAKYNVMVAGFKVDESPLSFGTIGPGKRVEVGIMRIWHDNDDMHVRWHQRRDESDAPQTVVEKIPSKI